MTREEVALLVHHSDSAFLADRPCNTANALDIKTYWLAEELPRTMVGCQKFRNYKHILLVSCNGKWIDSGKFPPLLGSFATIPTAKWVGALDCTRYKYLDAIRMDIAFSNCLSVGGFCYALILIDPTTQYNWTFGLKTLSLDCILLALWLFHASAWSLAKCFYSNCDVTLFGMAISKYLIDADSKVVAALSKCQPLSELVESHWKTMAHMYRAYLMEKQMPCTFWFYAITHATCMMKAIPGTYSGPLVSPFLLIHGIGHDECTWIPIFFLCYFHHKRDSNQQGSKHQACTMDGIVVGCSLALNALMVYNPHNKQYYEPDSY
jgi:hypothetical protein